MITVTLRRKDLVEKKACDLSLYDAIAAMSPPVRVRLRGGRVVERRDRIRVRWSMLAQLWLAREYPAWSGWLQAQGLTPNIGLSDAYLGGANLEGANLRGANLEGANLEGANLRGANLEGANLGGANLEGANLERANLGGAYLERAYLGGANLGGAYLERAYLGGANLEGANLEGANLGGARRHSTDPAIPGWDLTNNHLVRKLA